MTTPLPVDLDQHSADFIDGEVRAGRYASRNDVVRAGLTLLKEHKSRIEALAAALRDGEESGEPRPFDDTAFVQRMRARTSR